MCGGEGGKTAREGPQQGDRRTGREQETGSGTRRALDDGSLGPRKYPNLRNAVLIQSHLPAHPVWLWFWFWRLAVSPRASSDVSRFHRGARVPRDPGAEGPYPGSPARGGSPPRKMPRDPRSQGLPDQQPCPHTESTAIGGAPGAWEMEALVGDACGNGRGQGTPRPRRDSHPPAWAATTCVTQPAATTVGSQKRGARLEAPLSFSASEPWSRGHWIGCRTESSPPRLAQGSLPPGRRSSTE